MVGSEQAGWPGDAWVEAAYQRWVAFFQSMSGDAPEAERGCELGMRVVRSEVILSPEDTSEWAAFFCILIGMPNHATALCALGLQVVRGEVEADAALRREVEAILRA